MPEGFWTEGYSGPSQGWQAAHSASPLLRPRFHLPKRTQGTILKVLGLLIPPSLGAGDRALCTRENVICPNSEAAVLLGSAWSALCLGVPSAEECSRSPQPPFRWIQSTLFHLRPGSPNSSPGSLTQFLSARLFSLGT